MQTQQQTYCDVYLNLLNAQDLQPLTRFKSQRSATLLYPDAPTFPDFFNHNLMAPGRVIKSAKGKSALIRAFNYQLMKLTFEIQISDIDYVEVLKSVVFHPGLLRQDDQMQSPISGRGYTDRQYKRIIADFIELMGSQAIPNFQFTLMEYPIVDEALTYALEEIINHFCKVESSTQLLLNWLSQTFALTMQKHGKCYKFEESDMFLYEQGQNQYYLAFLNEMAEVSDYSETTIKFDESKERKSTLDRKNNNNIDKGFTPQFMQNIDEDLQFKLATDKYRYSAEPAGWRQKTDNQAHPVIRKTCNELMRDVLVKEIDESIEKDKPSDNSKQEPQNHSKIGSLLDIMSERSREDLSQNPKSPEVSSSRKFEEEEEKQPLTSRTDNQGIKIKITKEITPIEEEKHLTMSGESEMMTPQFTASHTSPTGGQNYNPFTKKYSQQYIKTYQKNLPQYSAYPTSNEYYFHNVSQEQDYKFSSDFQSPSEQYQYAAPSIYQAENKNNKEYSFQPGFSKSVSFGAEDNYQGYSSFLKESLEQLSTKKDPKPTLETDHKGQTPFQSHTYFANDYKSSFYENKYKPSSYFGTNDPQAEDISMKKKNIFELYEVKPYQQQPSADEDLFYHPPSSKFRSSKANELAVEGREDEKGTIYRQFTDTRVLEVMTSFQRLKTNAIRQRFYGVHRRDLYKRG